VHTEILQSGVLVKQLKDGHTISKDLCFSDYVELDLIACGFMMVLIAVNGRGELLDGRLVEDGSKASVG
jgi:hypothetical protein